MAIRPSRRQVLAGGLGATAALPLLGTPRLPRWLRSKEIYASSLSYKKLVIVQLVGANDWINNLVDPDEPTYAAARPTISLPKASMVRLDSTLPYHLHPELMPFKRLYDKGWLTMLPGIGYPVPNYSHFRSMDIWSEADPAARNVQRGWLADFLDNAYVGNDPITALDVERSLNRVFYGHPVPVVRNPDSFQFETDPATTVDQNVELAQIEQNAQFVRAAPNANLKFVADALGRVPADSRLLTTIGSTYTPRVTYPTVDPRLASDMQLCARYITGGLTTPIYQVSSGGWDTHANQVDATNRAGGRHAPLLAAMSGCIEAFLLDLDAWGAADDVLVMVWSEFGRRVGENGNLGCDHGHAGIAYLAGKLIKKPGIQSPLPAWTSVQPPYDKANFLHTVDFRSLYGTILEDYWGVDSAKVLGQKWAGLGLV